MNILDTINSILGLPDTFCGILPDKPDSVIALFEYPGPPPQQHFGGTDYSYGVQVRTRAEDPAEAYNKAEQAQSILNRYDSAAFCIRQSTSILDIGQDDDGRKEYTVNFLISMK